MLLRCESLEPPMSQLGQPLPSQDFCRKAALPLKSDIARRSWHGRKVPCVDGSELTRTFFTFAALVGAAMCSAFRCGSHGRWP